MNIGEKKNEKCFKKVKNPYTYSTSRRTISAFGMNNCYCTNFSVLFKKSLLKVDFRSQDCNPSNNYLSL